jgi:riboflavin kinase/FMN adenylyltransferase
MRIVRGLESYPPDAPPAAVALGVFDGIHLAHRKILAEAVARARQAALSAVACTFDPHPAQVLQPDRAPVPISTLGDRLALIGETGVETTVVLPFTLTLAAMEPEAFVKDVLVGRLHAREVVVGYNHTFGRGARGDARLLQELSDRLGFRARVIPPLLIDGVPASSTEVRAALREGDVVRAQRYLGRPYAIRGEVIRGAGRGRTLGFPTANIKPELPLLVPPGVYAGQVEVAGEGHGAVVNIGVRPTFDEHEVVIEAHLLDFSGVLYDVAIQLAFVLRLRPERKFAGVDALRQQIARDVAEARAVLANVGFTPAGPGDNLKCNC